MTPHATKRAALQENGRANARPVVDRVASYVEDRSLVKVHPILVSEAIRKAIEVFKCGPLGLRCGKTRSDRRDHCTSEMKPEVTATD
jgi:hypothetical protein